jgi:hypothetical protein
MMITEVGTVLTNPFGCPAKSWLKVFPNINLGVAHSQAEAEILL